MASKEITTAAKRNGANGMAANLGFESQLWWTANALRSNTK